MLLCRARKRVRLLKAQGVPIATGAVSAPLAELIAILGEGEDVTDLLGFPDQLVEGAAILLFQALAVELLLQQLCPNLILLAIVQMAIIRRPDLAPLEDPDRSSGPV